MRIGCNHVGSMYVGGLDSSFGGTFKDEEVIVEFGLSDIVPCTIGDITDAYEMLKEEIIRLKSDDFETVCRAIINTVCDYFGDYSNIDNRMDYYPDEDSIDYDNAEMGKVSNLKGKNNAMCVERAMLSQNLLQSVGYNSYYKASEITKDDNTEVHAYNLVEHDDKYYIFDTTIPSEKDGMMTPIITEITEEVFDQIKSPASRDGYSVVVDHYNPLRDVDVHITYDANRKNIYDTTSSIQK